MSEITPDTFETVARQLYNGERINTDSVDEGFVLGDYNTIWVGYKDGDAWIVAKMKKEEEVRGEGEYKMKTRRAEYVRVTFKRCYLSDEYSLEEVRDSFAGAKRIDRGYINGLRVTPLSEAVTNVFKWHRNS